MYSALNIAKYLIFRSHEENYCLNPLQLQSILFFIQKSFIELKGRRCFEDDVIAYDFGPVVLSVLERFGTTTCTLYYPEQGFLEGGIGDCHYEKFDKDIIEDSDKEMIDPILFVLADCSCSALSALLRMDSDYKKARETNSKIILFKD